MRSFSPPARKIYLHILRLRIPPSTFRLQTSTHSSTYREGEMSRLSGGETGCAHDASEETCIKKGVQRTREEWIARLWRDSIWLIVELCGIWEVLNKFHMYSRQVELQSCWEMGSRTWGEDMKLLFVGAEQKMQKTKSGSSHVDTLQSKWLGIQEPKMTEFHAGK